MATYDIHNPGGVIGAVGDRAIGTVSAPAPVRDAADRPGPTIGLIAALPEEHVPIEHMIAGARRMNVPEDRAAYRLGRLPSLDPSVPHQVVLTLSGDTGNAPAADACTNLIRSFPSVGYVLMVGIAAGVPRAGVRPGDVLVSTAGIVDYDHVVEYPDRVELRRPFPRPSPMFLRAVRELQMQDSLGRRPWTRWLAADADLPGYGRPDGDPPPFPRIHQGRIGSADRSLSNETRRDELATRHNLIGFEMEGAGIGNSGFLNGLEYLVVRGVSDLGQGGRDDTWRHYAALAAAAYACGLLEMCAPVTPRGGRTRGVPG